MRIGTFSNVFEGASAIEIKAEQDQGTGKVSVKKCCDRYSRCRGCFVVCRVLSELMVNGDLIAYKPAGEGKGKCFRAQAIAHKNIFPEPK